MALARIHHQAEYAGARPEIAHAAFDRLLASCEAAAFTIDTVLDQHTPGRRTPGEVRALFAKADVVLTTRLHGLVLALAAGVPALAVDPIPGGAKVIAQARALTWPAVLPVEALDDDELGRLFQWCLTAEAHERAQACALAGVEGIDAVRASLMKHLARTDSRRLHASVRVLHPRWPNREAQGIVGEDPPSLPLTGAAASRKPSNMGAQ